MVDAGGSTSMPRERDRARFTATTPNPKMSTTTIRIKITISITAARYRAGVTRLSRRPRSCAWPAVRGQDAPKAAVWTLTMIQMDHAHRSMTI
jgi:hypothetical protein